MKYLVSAYFDDGTNRQIKKHMEAVARTTGNDYMLAHRVPPHITISSFETENILPVQNALQIKLDDAFCGNVQWVGSGAFMTSVLYLTPVLNEYLQMLMRDVHDCLQTIPGVSISKYYRPYQWLPHTTIGKKMNGDELIKGFEVVQGDFRIIHGKVLQIGLAKAGPYEEIEVWDLK